MSDTIRLAGMRFEGVHGVSDEERQLPQLLEVDLEVAADLSRAAASDDLADTRVLHDIAGRTSDGTSARALSGLSMAVAWWTCFTMAMVMAFPSFRSRARRAARLLRDCFAARLWRNS